MSDKTTPTDASIAAMLRARSAGAAPSDLADDILRAVMADEPRRRLGSGRLFRLPRVRTFPLLVAATLVLAIAGGVLFLAGSANPTPRLSSSPTDAALLPSCPELDDLARRGGVGTGADPIPSAPAGVPANGDILLVAANETEIAQFDPLAQRPGLIRATAWDLPLLAVHAIVGSADGSVVALAVGGSLRGGCADVVVMKPDGASLRRPFGQVPDGVTIDPVWSPDGTHLAAIRQTTTPGPIRTGVDLGSLLIWDATAGTTRDIGGPCVGCMTIGAPFWSPDGDRLAVMYAEGECLVPWLQPGSTPAPTPSSLPLCARRGIAISRATGGWTLIPVGKSPDATGSSTLPSLVDMIGWADGHTVIVQADDTLAGLDADSGLLRTIRIAPPAGRQLSTDRTKTVGSLGDGKQSWIDVIDVASGAETQTALPLPDVFNVTWSPDSHWIAFQAASLDGTDRGIFAVPADGSAASRRVLYGAFGIMGWLAASSTAP
ncbi:MAG: hypothetical protein ACRDF7_06220 [Candidatus Limnocylindrales bacterium]